MSKAASNDAVKDLDFEQSIAELEHIVQRLEAGDLKLEDALGAFEQGIRLSRECQQALQQAEQRVQQLTQNASGEWEETAFPTGSAE